MHTDYDEDETEVFATDAAPSMIALGVIVGLVCLGILTHSVVDDMSDVEKDEVSELLMQISVSLSHLSKALGSSYENSTRITQDEKMALLSFCANGGDSLRNLAILMFRPHTTGRS